MTVVALIPSCQTHDYERELGSHPQHSATLGRKSAVLTKAKAPEMVEITSQMP